MHKFILLALLLQVLPLEALAGPLTVVINPAGKQALDGACREKLAEALGQLELEVLPREADAVTGDLVVNVKMEKDAGAGENPAGCELLVFVTPVGRKLVTLQKSAKTPLAACRRAAGALQEQLRAPLKKLIDRGLPYTVVLRWSKPMKPGPDLRLQQWFSKKGLSAKPVVQTSNRCTFQLDCKEAPGVFGEQLESFLSRHYKVTREPPDNLPRARRTFMFLLR